MVAPGRPARSVSLHGSGRALSLVQVQINKQLMLQAFGILCVTAPPEPHSRWRA
jgi:hypothetical protein